MIKKNARLVAACRAYFHGTKTKINRRKSGIKIRKMKKTELNLGDVVLIHISSISSQKLKCEKTEEHSLIAGTIIQFCNDNYVQLQLLPNLGKAIVDIKYVTKNTDSIPVKY